MQTNQLNVQRFDCLNTCAGEMYDAKLQKKKPKSKRMRKKKIFENPKRLKE